eukprot:scaffold2272_cov35-Cyclotella_meneghiniana.AAC.3
MTQQSIGMRTGVWGVDNSETNATISWNSRGRGGEMRKNTTIVGHISGRWGGKENTTTNRKTKTDKCSGWGRRGGMRSNTTINQSG